MSTHGPSASDDHLAARARSAERAAGAVAPPVRPDGADRVVDRAQRPPAGTRVAVLALVLGLVVPGAAWLVRVADVGIDLDGTDGSEVAGPTDPESPEPPVVDGSAEDDTGEGWEIEVGDDQEYSLGNAAGVDLGVQLVVAPLDGREGTGSGLRAVDVQAGMVRVLSHPRTGAIDADSLVRRGPLVAFTSGGRVFLAYHDALDVPWALAQAERIEPGAEEDALWLIDGDGSVDRRVRKVRTDGTELVGWSDVPEGWTVKGAVSTGMVVSDGTESAVWDPRRDEVELTTVSEGSGQLHGIGIHHVAACVPRDDAYPCEELELRDVRTGDALVLDAEEGRHWLPVSGGITSPDQSRVVLVTAEHSDSGQPENVRLVTVDLASGLQRGVLRTTTPPARVAWGPDSDVLVATRRTSDRHVDLVSLRADFHWSGAVGGTPVGVALTTPPDRGQGGPWISEPVPVPGPLGLTGGRTARAILAEGAYGGTVRSVDPVTAEVVWTKDLGAMSRLLGVADGAAVVTPGAGRIEALGDGGEVRWDLDLDEHEQPGVIAADDASGTVIVPSSWPGSAPYPTALRGLGPDGAERWLYRGRPGTMWQWAPPVIAGGTVLIADVASQDGPASGTELHAIDAVTGEALWRTPVSDETVHHHRVPWVNGDMVVVTTEHGAVAVGLDDGTPRWELDASRWTGDHFPGNVEVLEGDGDTVELRAGIARVVVDARTGEVIRHGPLTH